MSAVRETRAVVTGGASGIGATIVSTLAATGMSGFVLDRAESELPGGWQAIALDIRDDEAVEAAFDRIGPEIDALVAAAGIVPPWAGIAELDLGTWDETFAVNVRGLASTLRAAAPRLRDGAAVVAIGSLNSWKGDPNIAAYVASKHAVLGLVRSAALDLGRRGIRVNAVGPGPIATDALLARMSRREAELGTPVAEALAAAARQTALGRMATVDDVAAAVLFLLGPGAAGVTGHLLPVDAGIL